MSETADVDVRGDEFVFPNERSGEKFVRTLSDSNAFCNWCLVPLEPNPIVRFPGEDEGAPLTTVATFDDFGAPVTDVPIDKKDEEGNIVEYTREKQTICGSCGVVDIGPQYSRDAETTKQALRYLCAILQENETEVNHVVALDVVDEAFAAGRTGQFHQVLGEALYRATGNEI